MKIVKALFWAVAALAALLLGGGVLLPGTFKVEREVSVSAPPERVYALVADPREWRRWSVWNRRDPQMAMTYGGPASGAGATWAWRSESQGNGSMSFTAAEPARRVAFELRFEDFGRPSTGELRFEPTTGGTRVTWAMQGDMGPNPLYHWFALFADRLVGPDFAGGLANLKQVAEGG